MEDALSSIDNQTTESTDTETGTPDTTSALNDSSPNLTQSEQSKPYSPFANGKEKFKVDGKEEEWDWETTRRFAQIGKAGYVRMEQAKSIEKKATETYKQLLDLAQRDPEGLISMFNPQYRPQARAQVSAQADDGQDTQAIDPRDQKIHQLEQHLERINSHFEKQAVESEKAAIAQELAAAEQKFPVLKGDQVLMAYVKNEYKRLLQAGVEDVSIEDVAFHVAQAEKEKQQKRVLEAQRRNQENRNKLPVSGTPTGGSGQSKGMTREDVMRLAGKIQ